MISIPKKIYPFQSIPQQGIDRKNPCLAQETRAGFAGAQDAQGEAAPKVEEMPGLPDGERPGNFGHEIALIGGI